MTMTHHDATHGVRLGRRAALTGGAALAAAALLRTARSAPPDAAPSFERLAARWVELAGALLEDPSAADEARFVRRIDDLVSELPAAALPRRTRTVFDQGGLRSGPAWADGKTFLVELTLDPGTVIQAHNHPGFAVLTAVLEGEATCRHFEGDGELPPSTSRDPFPLREMRRLVMLPGRTSGLTRRRDNIHWFRAGEDGATLLDFTTRIGGADEGFSALELSDAPRDAHRGIFEARWIGNPYK